MRLPWIAAHRSLAEYRAVEGLPAARLLGTELDARTRERFTAELTARGLDPESYLWLPVHPWQWDEVVVPIFAPDVAARRIAPLGDGPDRYLPQQSIRTFTNMDQPRRHHVKLSLSILNTLVWRGLPTERTLAAPAVTEWILGIARTDPFLREETRPELLGEVASVTVRHPLLEEIPGVPYQYRELLGAIWRDRSTPRSHRGSGHGPWPRCCTPAGTGGPSSPNSSRVPEVTHGIGCGGCSARCSRRCCTFSTATLGLSSVFGDTPGR